jgi:hypothetical protein
MPMVTLAATVVILFFFLKLKHTSLLHVSRFMLHSISGALVSTSQLAFLPTLTLMFMMGTSTHFTSSRIIR